MAIWRFRFRHAACWLLRLDFVTPLPDVADRIQKWRDVTVNKATKAAEQTLLKTFKKCGASINSPESLTQLKDVVDKAEADADQYFHTLTVPLCRLGSINEVSTTRGKAMLEALQKAQNTEPSEDSSVKFGLAAAMVAKEREGVSTARRSKAKGKGKGAADKNSGKNCLMTLGKHMLK